MVSNTQSHNPGPTATGEDDAIIGTALAWSLMAFAVVGTAVGVSIYLLARPADVPALVETELATVEVREIVPMEIPSIPLTEVTEQAGIRFRHVNGAVGRKLLPETMGSGCALFDFDSDAGTNAIEIYVGRLRRKVGTALHIRTIRGLGYVAEPGADDGQ